MPRLQAREMHVTNPPHAGATTPHLSSDEALALSIVHEGCRIAQRVLSGSEHVETRCKADSSPVTVADFAVQCWAAHRMAAAARVLPLIGEESAAGLREAGPGMLAAVYAALPARHRPAHPDGLLEWLTGAAGLQAGQADAWWLLDPIDGTQGFLRQGQYAVCLALVREGRPVLGLLGCPALPWSGLPQAGLEASTGVLLLGRQGVGAWQAPLGDTPRWQPIRCSAADLGSRRIRVCESRDARHGQHGLLDGVLARMGVAPAPVRLDSQCKYALVARGDAEVFARLPHDRDYVEKAWDHAAGAVIAEAAGARVSDLDGHPLDFSQGARVTGRGVLVASAPWHAALIEALRSAETAN